MELILLAGQNIANKEWILEVESKLSHRFSKTTVVNYKHWEVAGETADVEHESERFIELTSSIEGDYMVFAKSIGTVIILNALKKLTHKPNSVIIFGVPFKLAGEKGYDFMKLREIANFPVYIYQKAHDPYCDFEDLKVISGENVEVNLYEGPGEFDDDHHYANLEYIEELVGRILQRDNHYTSKLAKQYSSE